MLKFSRTRKHVKHCPCGRSNADGKFVPYIGHTACGYCHSCGQTFLPQQQTPLFSAPAAPVVEPPATPVPVEVLNDSIDDCRRNNFVQGLIRRYGKAATLTAINLYYLGTHAHYTGGNVFWYVNQHGTVITGKVMVYNPFTLKRIKNKPPTWVHYLLKLGPAKPCLFGLHLLPQSTGKTIIIVESEKTAVLGSMHHPNYLWLASGGASSLNLQKLLPLKGHRVILMPDAGAYPQWEEIADQAYLMHINTTISNLLETAPWVTHEDRAAKLDIGDYL